MYGSSAVTHGPPMDMIKSSCNRLDSWKSACGTSSSRSTAFRFQGLRPSWSWEDLRSVPPTVSIHIPGMSTFTPSPTDKTSVRSCRRLSRPFILREPSTISPVVSSLLCFNSTSRTSAQTPSRRHLPGLISPSTDSHDHVGARYGNDLVDGRKSACLV